MTTPDQLEQDVAAILGFDPGEAVVARPARARMPIALPLALAGASVFGLALVLVRPVAAPEHPVFTSGVARVNVPSIPDAVLPEAASDIARSDDAAIHLVKRVPARSASRPARSSAAAPAEETIRVEPPSGQANIVIAIAPPSSSANAVSRPEPVVVPFIPTVSPPPAEPVGSPRDEARSRDQRSLDAIRLLRRQ